MLIADYYTFIADGLSFMVAYITLTIFYFDSPLTRLNLVDFHLCRHHFYKIKIHAGYSIIIKYTISATNDKFIKATNIDLHF